MPIVEVTGIPETDEVPLLVVYLHGFISDEGQASNQKFTRGNRSCRKNRMIVSSIITYRDNQMIDSGEILMVN